MLGAAGAAWQKVPALQPRCPMAQLLPPPMPSPTAAPAALGLHPSIAQGGQRVGRASRAAALWPHVLCLWPGTHLALAHLSPGSASTKKPSEMLPGTFLCLICLSFASRSSPGPRLLTPVLMVLLSSRRAQVTRMLHHGKPWRSMCKGLVLGTLLTSFMLLLYSYAIPPLQVSVTE